MIARSVQSDRLRMSKSAALSSSYVEHVARLEQRLSTDEALRRAVGGEFVAIGKLEYHLLRSRGLKDDHVVVDVGCGSGRLACQLVPFPRIRYIGCDVVPRLLDYARDLCGRPDWRFEATNGTTIPSDSAEADFVCFFSVFTHLHQEDIYRYLREAHRVLKPGGLLVMSFLEFQIPSHWAAFIASVDQTREDRHLNQFVDRASIHAWANPAGFDVRSIHGGDTDYIPLPEEVAYESGARVSGAASLGQSVAVLQKRITSSPVGARTTTESTSHSRPDVTHATVASSAATATSAPAAPLQNVSIRAQVHAGHSVTAGFLIGGHSEHRVLIRAIGPTLSVFGIPDPLQHPILQIFRGDVPHAEAATSWGGNPEIATAAAKVGAFTLLADSHDVALVTTLPPGAYSAIAKGATPLDEGEVLIEVYLVD